MTDPRKPPHSVADTFGDSVYLPIARQVFDATDAHMVVLIVLGGALGDGFCVAQREGFGTKVPALLRFFAAKVDDRLQENPIERRRLEDGTATAANTPPAGRSKRARPRWRR